MATVAWSLERELSMPARVPRRCAEQSLQRSKFEQNRSALVKRDARLGAKYYVLGPPARVKRIRFCVRE